MDNVKDNSITDIVPADNIDSELFEVNYSVPVKQSLAYLPTLFTTASLPLRNVKKTVFTRKGSNGITLKLTSPLNVPYGLYGRLLLSVLTTHAVLAKNQEGLVCIEYAKLGDLLKEMQLPKTRGLDVKTQLECFSNATFSFSQKVSELQSGYLFEDLYEDGNYPKKDVVVTTHSTGNIRFTEGVQYKDIDDGSTEKRCFGFKIVLSPEFSNFCKKHAVPINYTVYKELKSSVGKDIYAWLIYRNHSIKKPTFIPRHKLVEQFMPADDAKNKYQENTNYSRIIEQIKEIKEKYYPDLNIEIDSKGSGITLRKSPEQIKGNDIRYALITSDI